MMHHLAKEFFNYQSDNRRTDKNTMSGYIQWKKSKFYNVCDEKESKNIYVHGLIMIENECLNNQKICQVLKVKSLLSTKWSLQGV
jgi:hypothetical protein